MDRETYNLRQKWAKENIKNCNRNISKKQEEIRSAQEIIEINKKQLKYYEAMKNESYEDFINRVNEINLKENICKECANYNIGDGIDDITKCKCNVKITKKGNAKNE